MFKTTMTFKDYDGNSRTEDFYFNLDVDELAKFQLSTSGGLDVYVNRILAAQDTPTIIKVFEEIIDISYGIKSDDGKYFRKSPEILADFKATKAYSQLYYKLGTDDKFAAEFINGILPPKEEIEAAKQLEAAQKKDGNTVPFQPQDHLKPGGNNNK